MAVLERVGYHYVLANQILNMLFSQVSDQKVVIKLLMSVEASSLFASTEDGDIRTWQRFPLHIKENALRPFPVEQFFPYAGVNLKGAYQSRPL